MKPGVIYRGQYKDVQREDAVSNQLDAKTFTVNIYDTSIQIDDADNEDIVPLNMADDPCREVTSNNDEDKFSPILSRTKEIKVHTTEAVSLNTFAGGDDNRFYVEILIESTVDFKGYLLLSDLQQDFMPDPNVLLLVATDNLAKLKDIPLVDFNDENPVGYNRLMDYIVWALAKTGLSLGLKVFCNLREKDTRPWTDDATFAAGVNQIGVNAGPSFFRPGKKITVSNTASNNGTFTINSIIVSGSTVTLNVAETVVNEVGVGAIFSDASANFYNDNFVEAKTFEKEIGESEDGYTVIEKILGEHSRLIQQWGQWWIIAIDELENTNMYGSNFDEEGEFIDHDDPDNYFKEIGSEKKIYFINEDAICKPTIPHKYIKETFRLTTPIEIICNIDFSRGNLLTEGAGFKTYELDDWTLFKDFPTGGSPASTKYIKREFNDLDFEEVRYAVLTPEASTSETGMMACGVPVGKNDIIELLFDWRFSSNAADSGPYTRRVAIARIEGDDGTYWTLEDDRKWYQSNSTWTVNLKILEQTIDTADDERETQNYSIKSNKIPVDGTLYIHLLSESQSRYNVDIYFNNLQLNYYAFVSDGYRVVKEQYHKISAIVNNNIKRENEVYISDSPRKIFKGGLYKFYQDEYLPVETFYKGNLFPNNDPPDYEFKTFGEWQAWWVWNQFRLCNREFDFTAQGYDSNEVKNGNQYPISPVQKFVITDGNESTTGRHFMLLHHEANTHLGEWEGFLSEVYNENEGKVPLNEILQRVVNWVSITHDGGVRYFIDVQNTESSDGYYDTDDQPPPFPGSINLDDFTKVADGPGSFATYILANYTGWVGGIVNTGNQSTLDELVTTIDAEHEFKYVLE